ncbi:MAG: 1,4-dihydroxy-2-naphthoate polyprenyltransferase [Halobacteriaceae archaeon]
MAEATASTDPSRARAWLVAARPQTLPAAASPVLVGTGLAVHHDVAAPLPALVALLGAALIQVGTNFANDYFDAVKGADDPDRAGFTRATASGLLSPSAVRRAAALTFGLAVCSGTYLVYLGGLPILVVGLSSVVAGVAYTGGPYPLGYHGLGDVFVFVFFGLVAVAGTYYVQAVAAATAAVPAPAAAFPLAPPAGTVPPSAVLAGVPVGALATAILVVNNVRDRESDAAAGKRTLAVRLGDRASRLQYVALLAVAYAVPCWYALAGGYGLAALAPLLTLPGAAVVTRTVRTAEGAALNRALENTGKLLLAFSALFAAGLAL